MFKNNFQKFWKVIYFGNTTNQKRHIKTNLKVPYSNPTNAYAQT